MLGVNFFFQILMYVSTIDKKKLSKGLEDCDKKGYAKFEQVVDQNSIKKCEETILALFKKYSPKDFSNFKNASFEDFEYHNAIINFKKSDRKTFGKIYDILQSSISLKALATSPLIINLASEFLNTASSNLMIRSTNIRMDVPEDTKNIVAWHHDVFSPNNSSHVPSGGLSVVVPFTSFSTENGCPEICLGSHKTPPTQKVEKGKGNDSAFHSIDQTYLDNFKKERMIGNPQDLILFPFLTVHRSGFNISNKVRVCALIRYYSYDDISFEPLNETYTPII